jgi:hypothetical protein
MAGPSGSSRISTSRLIALGLVLLAGLGLFFVLGRRTPVVIHPEVEVAP